MRFWSNSFLFAASSPRLAHRGLLTAACSPLHDWPPARVADWAASIISLENAALLKDQEICGKSLLKLRKHELKGFGMPHGPACNLVEAVSKLVSPGVWFVFIAARLPTSALPPASFAPDAPRSPRAALCGFLPLLRF